ncbi:hypothetical protein OVX45_27910, partial [Klebsiella pneumoniae]|nr:hypothetical protein [Klebsiella pneumoniae]
SELNQYKSVEKHDVNDSAFLVLEQFFLSEYIHPYGVKPLLEPLIKLFFLAELDVGQSRFDQIHKQIDSVSGYNQK